MLPFPKRPEKLWLCSNPFCIDSKCNKQHFIYKGGVKIKYLTKKEITEESSNSDTSGTESSDEEFNNFVNFKNDSEYNFIQNSRVYLKDDVTITLVKNIRKYGVSNTYKNRYISLYFAEIAMTFLLIMNRLKLNFEKNISLKIIKILLNQYYDNDKFLEYLQKYKFNLPSLCPFNYKCEDQNCNKIHFSILKGVTINYDQNKILPRPRNNNLYLKELTKYYKAIPNISKTLELRLHYKDSKTCKLRWIETYNKKIIRTLLLCVNRKYNIFLNYDLSLKIFITAFGEHIHLLHRNCRYFLCNNSNCKFSHKCPKCGLYIVNYFNHSC